MRMGLRERLIAELPRYAPLAARFDGIANLRNGNRLLRRLSDRAIGFSSNAPCLHGEEIGSAITSCATGGTLRSDARGGDVMLFVDTFNRYFEPENVRAAIKVIAATGRRIASALRRSAALLRADVPLGGFGGPGASRSAANARGARRRRAGHRLGAVLPIDFPRSSSCRFCRAMKPNGSRVAPRPHRRLATRESVSLDFRR